MPRLINNKLNDALKILDDSIVNDPELIALVAEETMKADIAAMIRDARQQAGLTQKQLAELVKTTQSVIARLEDADYQGHSLTMLHRVANALGKQLVIHFS